MRMNHATELNLAGLCATDRAMPHEAAYSCRGRNAKRINCPECLLLLSVIKANGWERLLISQHHELVQAVREVLRD